jgi:hydrophobic/amphiphilic exporter-1 (mainly G- bacteria), HAE1 family
MDIVLTAIKRPIFITCIFILILAIGYLSLKKLPVDLFPDVTFPVVVVNTPYKGSAPSEVEQLVSKVIEDELSSLGGVKTIRSVNKEGLSTVVAEFVLGTDIKNAEQQVRDRVANAKRKLPIDIDEFTIRRVDPSDQPVLTVALEGELEDADLFDFADQFVKPKLQQVDQVGLIDILGGRKREIRVDLDQRKLGAYQVSATQVVSRIGAAGENVPAGKVPEGNIDLVYRTLAEFKSLKDIGNVIVNYLSIENPVRVKDLATITDTLEEEKSRVFLNGKKALIFNVFRQSGSNTVAVVEAAKKRVDQINETLAKDTRKLHLQVVSDNSKRINANIMDVKESIYIGIALTILVVLFFLGNLRSTFITSLALPNSLLGAFILMSAFGFSINIMSLLALSLAVGLLIDDAIVVRENIFRHLEMGKSPRDAALEGSKEVMLAVIATTMTVVAVFGPIGFLQGVVGQFFKQFGLTICFAMMISLFDALTMAPMMSAHLAGKVKPHHGSSDIPDEKPGFLSRIWDSTMGVPLRAFDRFQSSLENRYEKILVSTLRFPKTVLLTGVIIFAVSLFALKFVPKTFLPPQDNGEFSVRIETPPGTNLQYMSTQAQMVSQLIRTHPEVNLVITTVGDRDGEGSKASFFVQLVPGKERKMNTSDFKDIIRKDLTAHPELKPVVSDVDNVGGGARPFTVNFSGSDLTVLEEYTQKFFEKVKSHPSLKDVEWSYKAGKPEFQIRISPDKAQALGVSTKAVGQELRTLVEGTKAAVFRQGIFEYNIRVRSQEDQRNLKEHFGQVYIPAINQKMTRLQFVAEPVSSSGPAEINRENRNRYISISADIAPNGPGMAGAIAELTRISKTELPLPEGVTYKLVGQAENFQELMVNMMIALGLGVLFIYLVLASLYESFITPFTIMLVLPLALCGAFYALLVMQRSLDLFSMIGCVMLMGVATKNSILIVDYVNQLLEKGLERKEAIILAGKTRLRPILMTSFALIAGMLPVAIGLNEASKQRTSMGVAIIGGLISSTVLTLVIVPAAFLYIDRFRLWVNKLWSKV